MLRIDLTTRRRNIGLVSWPVHAPVLDAVKMLRFICRSVEPPPVPPSLDVFEPLLKAFECCAQVIAGRAKGTSDDLDLFHHGAGNLLAREINDRGDRFRSVFQGTDAAAFADRLGESGNIFSAHYRETLRSGTAANGYSVAFDMIRLIKAEAQQGLSARRLVLGSLSCQIAYRPDRKLDDVRASLRASSHP